MPRPDVRSERLVRSRPDWSVPSLAWQWPCTQFYALRTVDKCGALCLYLWTLWNSQPVCWSSQNRPLLPSISFWIASRKQHWWKPFFVCLFVFLSFLLWQRWERQRWADCSDLIETSVFQASAGLNTQFSQLNESCEELWRADVLHYKANSSSVFLIGY